MLEKCSPLFAPNDDASFVHLVVNVPSRDDGDDWKKGRSEGLPIMRRGVLQKPTANTVSEMILFFDDVSLFSNMTPR